MYSPNDLGLIREALERQRTGLLEQIREGMTESEQHQFSAVLGQSSGDSSDEALATSLGDLSAARLDMEIRRLRELDAAQKRVGQDGFGICEDCGSAIPLSRMVANPAAIRCIGCQEKFEKMHAGQPRGSL